MAKKKNEKVQCFPTLGAVVTEEERRDVWGRKLRGGQGGSCNKTDKI